MTLSTLNKNITSLQKQIHTKVEIKKRLKKILETQNSINQKIIVHESILVKEFKDVEALEALNMKSLFVTLLGDIKHQLDKERQEYLHAILRHRALIDELELLRYEHGILSKKLKTLSTVTQTDLANLIAQKASFLKRNDSRFYKKMISFDNKIGIYNHKLYRLKLAHQQGLKCLSGLEVLLYDLRHITSWGSISAYHGKGRYSSMKKKFYIDKARTKATKAKVNIDKYEQLVEKIFIDLDVQLSLESFEEFLDDFFDNLITDWIIQKKIKNAIYGIEMNLDKIKRHNLALTSEKNNYVLQLKEIEKSRKLFIKNY